MSQSLPTPGLPRRNRLRPLIWCGAGLLLLLPWLAMQFTREVQWSGLDFAVFGAMLLLACGSYEIATRMSADPLYRAGAGVAVITGFVLVWANLAVGIIGSPANPLNRVFLAVVGMAALGSLLVRWRAAGLAPLMLATALAQAGGALLAGWFGSRYEGLLTLAFCLPWLLSAALFRQAARRAT